MTPEQKMQYMRAYAKAVTTGDYSEVNSLARQLMPCSPTPLLYQSPLCPEVKEPNK